MSRLFLCPQVPVIYIGFIERMCYDILLTGICIQCSNTASDVVVPRRLILKMCEN